MCTIKESKQWELSMEIKSREIVFLDPQSLEPHPENPHINSEEKLERLGELIDYQGLRNPIIIDKKSGFVVAGCGRLEVSKRKNIKEIPAIIEEFDSEEQVYAYIVSDNAIGKDEWAFLDKSQINLAITDLGPSFNIEMLGIKGFTLDMSEKDLPDKDLPDREIRDAPFIQPVTFILSNDQKDILDAAMSKARKTEEWEDELNHDEKGNVLSSILKRYLYG